MIERYEIGQLYRFVDELTGNLWRELRQGWNLLESDMRFHDLPGRSVEQYGRKQD